MMDESNSLFHISVTGRHDIVLNYRVCTFNKIMDKLNSLFHIRVGFFLTFPLERERDVTFEVFMVQALVAGVMKFSLLLTC